MLEAPLKSFEVKMSLYGHPESDVSFFMWCVQHKRELGVIIAISLAFWPRAKVSGHKVCANMPVSLLVSE
jgi:hypothetical protein